MEEEILTSIPLCPMILWWRKMILLLFPLSYVMENHKRCDEEILLCVGVIIGCAFRWRQRNNNNYVP